MSGRQMSGGLAHGAVKITVLEKTGQPLLEVALASLVKRENLLGVKKTKLGHIAEEGDVAGLQLEGVGHPRALKWL